mgnify:CR=1 FL=1
MKLIAKPPNRNSLAITHNRNNRRRRKNLGRILTSALISYCVIAREFLVVLLSVAIIISITWTRVTSLKGTSSFQGCSTPHNHVMDMIMATEWLGIRPRNTSRRKRYHRMRWSLGIACFIPPVTSVTRSYTESHKYHNTLVINNAIISTFYQVIWFIIVRDIQIVIR